MHKLPGKNLTLTSICCTSLKNMSCQRTQTLHAWRGDVERLKTCRGLFSKHAAEASQKCRAAWRTSKQSSPVNMSTSERLYPKLLCCNTLRHCPSSLAAVPCWQAYVSDVRCSTGILRITVQQRKSLESSHAQRTRDSFPRIQLQWLDTVDSPNKKKGPAIENFRWILGMLGSRCWEPICFDVPKATRVSSWTNVLSAAQIGATTVGLANTFGRLCKRNLPAIPASFTYAYIYIYVCFFACLWLFLLALVWIARALSLSAQLHLISLVGWLGSLLSCLPMPTSSWCSVNCRVEPLSLAYPCSLRKLVGEVLCSVPDPRQNWLKGCFMHSFATKQQLQLQCKKSLLAKNHLYRISSLMTDMKPPTSRMNHLLCRSHALRSAWL